VKVVQTGKLSFEALEVRELMAAGSLRCGLAYFPPGCILPAEGTSRHEVDEFSYILEGRLSTFAGGETCEVGTGALIYIPRGEEHSAANVGDGPCRLIWFLVES
jgi:mannose-6-phosphate isomerase-like protein (cupin superfamily)